MPLTEEKVFVSLCIFAFTFLWISFSFKVYFYCFVLKHHKYFQSQQDKLNEATALNCCWVVETIIWFSFISPHYWTPTVPFLNASFSVPYYLCHCFLHSLCLCDRQKQIKAAFDMKSLNLLSCAFVYLLLASMKTKWSQCDCHYSWMSILLLQGTFHALGSPEFT